MYAQWYALAPVIARDVYGGAGVFGLLEAVAGVGAVCGGLLGIRWRPARPLLAGMLLVLAWPVQDGVFALGAPLALVVVCAFATGFGFSLLMIWWETALARHIPASALSRVSAWDWMGSLALLPLGFLLAGPLAAAFGRAHGARRRQRDRLRPAARRALAARDARARRIRLSRGARGEGRRRSRAAKPRSRTSIRSSALWISGAASSNGMYRCGKNP